MGGAEAAWGAGNRAKRCELNLGSRRRIVALLPTDEQLRGALGPIASWQRSLGCGVRIVLVGEEDRLLTAAAVERFRQWAGDVAGLKLSSGEVNVCTKDSVLASLAELGSKPNDLLMCPANASGVMALSRIPVGALWSQVAGGGASILFGQRRMAVRRVLVLTDGTPRTLPVLQSAFDLAEHMEVQLSHLDSFRMPLPWSLESSRALGATVNYERGGADGYLHAFRSTLTAVGAAQRELRPDLLLVGASRRDRGGALLNVLGASLLPCSILVVPV